MPNASDCFGSAKRKFSDSVTILNNLKDMAENRMLSSDQEVAKHVSEGLAKLSEGLEKLAIFLEAKR